MISDRVFGHLMAPGVVVLALLLLSGEFATCGQEREPDSPQQARIYAPLAKVPEKARAQQNPLEGDWQALAAGGKLFEEHCAECHGRKGEGGRNGASLLRPEVAEARPGALFWILSNGVLWRGMPDWSKLPEQQRWQIVSFLQSLKPSVGSGLEPPPVSP